MAARILSQLPLFRCCTKCGVEYPATPEYFRFREGRLTFPCKRCNQQKHREWCRKHTISSRRLAERKDGFIRCTKCQEWKTATLDVFRKKDGEFISQCRQCETDYKAQRRRAQGVPQRRLAEICDGEMQCLLCGKWKPATREFFLVNRKNKTGLVGHCKECRNKFIQTYRQLPHQSARERDYRIQYRIQHKDERSKYNQRYAIEHYEKRAAGRQNRRAHNRAAEGTHTAADIETQFKRQKGRCYYAFCGHVELGKTYHVDHVVPLSKGGRNDLSNLVLTCPKCNLSKGNKLPHEWTEGGRLL